MTIEIPTPPAYAEITIPAPPSLDLPTLTTPTLTEPTITDPTGSMQAFVYARYASAINTLLDGEIERLFSWEGDNELLTAENEKAQDAIMGELLSIHNKILSGSAAAGHMFLPGSARNSMMMADTDARSKLQESLVGSQAGLTENALKFISFASQAADGQIKVGIDENKRIVYANIAAVESTANALVEMNKNNISVFDGKVQAYEDQIKAVDAKLLQEESKVDFYHAGVTEARAGIKESAMGIDQKHAENLGVSINNASTLLSAQECLQDAELERQKVYQTHAIIQAFLAEIKLAHSSLVENRADVDIVLADLDVYRKEATLAESKARAVISEISGEQQRLNGHYKKSMAQISRAKADIRMVEAGMEEDRNDAKLRNETYRNNLYSKINRTDISDKETLTDNSVLLSNWISTIQGEFRWRNTYSDAARSGNASTLSGGISHAKNAARGCAKVNAATYTATGDSTLNLFHNIT